MSEDENCILEETFVSLMRNSYPNYSFDKSDEVWETGPTKHLKNKTLHNNLTSTNPRYCMTMQKQLFLHCVFSPRCNSRKTAASLARSSKGSFVTKEYEFQWFYIMKLNQTFEVERNLIQKRYLNEDRN